MGREAFNRGGGYSGEPVRKGDKCFGVKGSAAGKGKGKVLRVVDDMGNDMAEVKWDNGGTDWYRQWELQGTQL